MRVLSLLLVAVVALVASEPTRLTAVAFMRDTNPTQNLILGNVHFWQDEEGGDVHVEAFIFGNRDFLSSGAEYAMHVHQTGDITARDGSLMGPHYYFSGQGAPAHGCPENDNPQLRHTGDLGNFGVNSLHQLLGGKTLDLLETYNNTRSIVGRAVALKTQKDTCDFGFVGTPMAFGVIGLARNAPDSVGLTLQPDEHLVAWIYGAGDCTACQGQVWVTRASPGRIRVVAQVLLPTGTPDAHQFTITQYGDITTKGGELMGPHLQRPGQFHDFPGVPLVHDGDLGNNQWYSPYNSQQTETWKWMDREIAGNIDNIVGRGIQIFESYDRGSNCKNGGGGAIIAFGVFGIADSTNNPPGGFPSNIRPVGQLDNSFCACGVLGVSFTSALVVLMALFFVM